MKSNESKMAGNLIQLEQQANTFPDKDRIITQIKDSIFQCVDHSFSVNTNIKIITENNPYNLISNKMYRINEIIDGNHFTLHESENVFNANDTSISIECNSVSINGNVPPGLTFIGRRGSRNGSNASLVNYFPAKEGDYLGALRWNGNFSEGTFSEKSTETFTKSANAEFEVKASEDWSEHATGTTFQMWATPVGTTKRTVISSHSPESTTFISNRFIFQNDKDEEYLRMDLDNNIKLSGKLQLPTSKIPDSRNSFGKKGQIVFDDSYIYICVNDNEWKRSTLNDW